MSSQKSDASRGKSNVVRPPPSGSILQKQSSFIRPQQQHSDNVTSQPEHNTSLKTIPINERKSDTISATPQNGSHTAISQNENTFSTAVLTPANASKSNSHESVSVVRSIGPGGSSNKTFQAAPQTSAGHSLPTNGAQANSLASSKPRACEPFAVNGAHESKISHTSNAAAPTHKTNVPPSTPLPMQAVATRVANLENTTALDRHIQGSHVQVPSAISTAPRKAANPSAVNTSAGKGASMIPVTPRLASNVPINDQPTLPAASTNTNTNTNTPSTTTTAPPTPKSGNKKTKKTTVTSNSDATTANQSVATSTSNGNDKPGPKQDTIVSTSTKDATITVNPLDNVTKSGSNDTQSHPSSAVKPGVAVPMSTAPIIDLQPTRDSFYAMQPVMGSMYGMGGGMPGYGMQPPPMQRGSMYGMQQPPMQRGSMYGMGGGMGSMYGMQQPPMQRGSMYGMGGGMGSMYGMQAPMMGSMYGMGGGMGSMYGMQAPMMGSMYGMGGGMGSMYGMQAPMMGSMYGMGGGMGSMYGMRPGMGSMYGMGGGMGSMYGMRPAMNGVGMDALSSMYGGMGSGKVLSQGNSSNSDDMRSTARRDATPDTVNMANDECVSGMFRVTSDLDNEKVPIDELLDDVESLPAKPVLRRSGKRGGNRLYAEGMAVQPSEPEETATPEEPVTHPKQVTDTTPSKVNVNEHDKPLKDFAPRSLTEKHLENKAAEINQIHKVKPRAHVPSNYNVHTLCVVDDNGSTQVEADEPYKVLATRGEQKETFELDEVIRREKGTNEIRSVLLSELRGNWLNGHNSSLLMMSGAGKINEGTAVVRRFIYRSVARAMEESGAKSGFDVTMNIVSLRGSDMCCDLLSSDRSYEKVRLGSSPLYGPCLLGLESQTVSTVDSCLSVFDRALNGAKLGEEIVVVFLLLKRYKISTTEKEVRLSSLFVSLFGDNIASVTDLRNKSHYSPHRLFRYCLGGASVTVSALCLSSTDATSIKALNELKALSQVKNSPPRSGNIKRFIDYTENEIERQRQKMERLPEQDKSAREEQIKRMEEMVDDAKKLFNDYTLPAFMGYQFN